MADNNTDWTGKTFAETQALAHNFKGWRQLVHRSSPKEEKMRQPEEKSGQTRSQIGQIGDPSPCTRPHRLDKITFAETQALPYDLKYGDSWYTIDP